MVQTNQLTLWMRWLRSNLSYAQAPASLDAKFHRLQRKSIVPFLVAFIFFQVVASLIYIFLEAIDERSNVPIVLNIVTLGFHGLELGLLLVFCRQEQAIILYYNIYIYTYI